MPPLPVRSAKLTGAAHPSPPPGSGGHAPARRGGQVTWREAGRTGRGGTRRGSTCCSYYGNAARRWRGRGARTRQGPGQVSRCSGLCRPAAGRGQPRRPQEAGSCLRAAGGPPRGWCCFQPRLLPATFSLPSHPAAPQAPRAGERTPRSAASLGPPPGELREKLWLGAPCQRPAAAAWPRREPRGLAWPEVESSASQPAAVPWAQPFKIKIMAHRISSFAASSNPHYKCPRFPVNAGTSRWPPPSQC